MSTKNDGGPAFPSHGTMGEVAHAGMTLRDYFAAKVLAAIIARPIEEGYDVSAEMTLDDFAGDAYAFADAMLRAREA